MAGHPPQSPIDGCPARSAEPNPCLALARSTKLWRLLPDTHHEAPPPQNPCHCASCTVVATRIEWTATPAVASGTRQGKPETTQEENTERLCVKTRMHSGGETREWQPCHGATLGTQQGSRWTWKARPHCPAQITIFHLLGCLKLPPLLHPWLCIVKIIPGHKRLG